MPLMNLKRQGLIEDYYVTNPSLFDVPSDFPIDVVWLQRISSSRLLDHLSKVIDNQYLYDLDDLLISNARYNGRELIDQGAVEEAVRRCSVLRDFAPFDGGFGKVCWIACEAKNGRLSQRLRIHAAAENSGSARGNCCSFNR